MSDARLIYDAEKSAFDLSLAGGDLAQDEGLETSVLISLFTDRRANDEDPLPGGDDRRGWWGDAFGDIDGDRVGSRLWLLSREKQTQTALNRAKEYAEEALRWLIEDGIARSVTVSAQIVSSGVLGLEVEIARAKKPVAQYRFDVFWRGA